MITCTSRVSLESESRRRPRKEKKSGTRALQIAKGCFRQGAPLAKPARDGVICRVRVGSSLRYARTAASCGVDVWRLKCESNVVVETADVRTTTHTNSWVPTAAMIVAKLGGMAFTTGKKTSVIVGDASFDVSANIFSARMSAATSRSSFQDTSISLFGCHVGVEPRTVCEDRESPPAHTGVSRH